ncbi:hypothetical protein OK006_9421 [Actinobacteria bacterium OK006]|nr:hypothetical protein OK006_9421 [Actinobacteria bacterium OK006]
MVVEGEDLRGDALEERAHNTDVPTDQAAEDPRRLIPRDGCGDRWTQLGGQDETASTGVSAARHHEDGRLADITGFFLPA